MIELDRERKAFLRLYAEIYGEHDPICHGWKILAEQAEEEIFHLQQQLAKYQDPNYVLVPRKPTKEMLDEGEKYHSYFTVGDEIGHIYDAMIQAYENYI